MSSAGLILALIGAGRVKTATALLMDRRLEARRAVWRERATRGAQWFATAELAAALATAAGGDVAGGRRMVAETHALLGRDRFSGVDADFVARLAAICRVAGEPDRARALLAGTVRVTRTPVTMALAYRTLAAVSGQTDGGTIEWRVAEVIRRWPLDRAEVDAAARRMVAAELERLGLSG
jgi:hypothetical protein